MYKNVKDDVYRKDEAIGIVGPTFLSDKKNPSMFIQGDVFLSKRDIFFVRWDFFTLGLTINQYHTSRNNYPRPLKNVAVALKSLKCP